MFKKGQPVHFIASLNGRAKVAVYRGVVRSCTKTRMVIGSDETSHFLGKVFRPQQDQAHGGRVFAGHTDIQAESIAEAMCDEIRMREIERCEKSIKTYCLRGANDDTYPVMKRNEIRSLIAEPAKVLWRAQGEAA